MLKFEVGKRYAEIEGLVFEVIKRTDKFVVVSLIQHAGRYNEKVKETKRIKINFWDEEEVIFHNCYEVHASNLYRGEE